MEMGTIRTKVSRSHSEIIAFLSSTFCNPNPTYDITTCISVTDKKPSVRQNPFGSSLKKGQVYFRINSNSKEALCGLL